MWAASQTDRLAMDRKLAGWCRKVVTRQVWELVVEVREELALLTGGEGDRK